jgi:GT2 family glycosyltransferase
VSAGRVAVVIPNFNGERLLPACLAALAGQTRAADRVIVVDNGSSDGSRELLAREHPDVELFALGRNRGFGAAANRGARECDCERVAILNSDARPHPDWLEQLLAAPAPEDVWAWGSVLISGDGLVESAGDHWSEEGYALKLANGANPGELPDEPYDVLAPPGPAPLFRRDRFLELGGYEESFFLYFEDIDLALRALLRGWRVLAVPRARVAHDLGASGRGWQRRYYVGRNALRCAVRCTPDPAPGRIARRALGELRRSGRPALAPFELAGRAAALARLPRTLRERRAIQAERVLTPEQVRERLAAPLERLGPITSARELRQ